MIEAPFAQHDESPMCVRICLEVGHKCDPPRHSALGRSLTLDWKVWVRGAGGGDISRFVHKVVFHLHPSSAFVYPKRVIQEPPYEIQESGCASIEIPIHVYLKHSNKPKKIRLKYSLEVENKPCGSSEKQFLYYDFENPSEQLWRSLMQGGGEVVGRTSAGPASPAGRAPAARLVLLCDKRYEFAAPSSRQRRQRRARRAEPPPCARCGDSLHVDFHKYLPSGRPGDLTPDEIERVSQLYLSFQRYERSRDPLRLPPLSDPIYRVPELPWSLKEALRAAKSTSQTTAEDHPSDCLEF